MFMYLNGKKGQSTLEYAILVLVIIAALIALQSYMKRGYQGRLKSATDDIGDQYSPGNTRSITATKSYSHTQQTYGMNAEDGSALQGVSTTKLLNDEVTNTVSKSVILNDQKENWGGDSTTATPSGG